MFKPVPALVAVAVSTVLFSTGAKADDLPINDAAQQMEVIVISGSRTEKPLKDVAGSISVVTAEEIERQVATDMSQLFKYDPSVQITGGIGGAQNIIVRGMGSDRILMIKDGMRMNEGYGANGLNDIVGRGFIETDTLKQVEVAKGAASSLYGSDALGGIVVFTTKDASDYLEDGETVGGNIKVGYSDLSSQANVSGTLALKTGDFEQMLNASYRDGEEEKRYNESQSPFTVESTSFLYKAKYNLNDTDYLGFSADLWRQTRKGESADGLLSYFRGLEQYGYKIEEENSTSEKSTDSFKLEYRSEANTALYDYLSVAVYSNSTNQDDEEYAFLDINAPMFGVIEKRDMWKTGYFEQQTTGFLSNATKELNGWNTLGYGLDIESSTSSRTVVEYREVEGEPTKDATTNKFPETDVFRAGLFVNDEMKFLDDRLTVTPGVRFDMYKMDPNGALKTDGEAFKKFDENHTSFNLGALYSISNYLTAYAQFGQGFKVPSYDLAYIEHTNSPSSDYTYTIIPSEDLAPEESNSYEIGLRGHVGDMAFTSAIFYNDYTNFLTTELVNTETIDGVRYETYQYNNIDSVTIKGAELGLTYYIGDELSIFANAAYQDGKNDNTGEYITSISPLSGTAGVSYESDTWSSDLVMNWADRMTKVNEGDAEVAGYAVVDWLLNYDISNNFRLNLAVNNLFDTEYVRYSNVSGHAEDFDMSQLTEAGRTFAASLSYKF
ncbi:TonB-dependent hemoglobin/transferrin/lactoferrin family receptor [Shewanella eurypsychrophilus]|uniref:TonB-dependent hemoglobin/transferrin/lactoferrin family receptor n=1 Tax=Shewanella eurypsychrophilus TaxID=2593656 RepID=A0ABX6V9X3_9GAMM|nr:MULTISPECIES: TonB-dependent hemoglobin/transferrin/lactoferrin family receptor [Shewanella]QFU24216.1 TonB-dependent hemoglobin/transferrin/lactoferrin family receptor [Shewanella sp. YLB-09]QPG59421.1 TonB-dependent hemoglobin/transferrin/lactoferrin family receptor [Shewanella eurypsychrophilus]